MTRVYLIRHAEAEGNVYRRAQGHYQSTITNKGLRQIDALAQRFKDIHIDALYSSDLRRTQTTAGAILRHHALTLNLEPGLREVCMGDWEDAPWGNLSADFPEAMTAFNDDPESWSAPNAESFVHLKQRMVETVQRLAAAHEGQTIALVSHGMAIRTLLSYVLGVPSAEIRRLPHGDNTAVSLLEVENGEMKAVFYNDAEHLGQLSTFARQTWWRAPGLHDTGNVVFRYIDPKAEAELYTSFYAETWQAVHGSLEGFEPRVYLASACRHYATHPESVAVIYMGEEPVGLTELDICGGSDSLRICLCCVREPYRRMLLGVQLLGHAVSLGRRLGKRALRLVVFPGNRSAVEFYRANGFEKIGSEEGVFGPLDLMEKEI